MSKKTLGSAVELVKPNETRKTWNRPTLSQLDIAATANATTDNAGDGGFTSS